MKVRICYAFAKAFFYNLYITGHNWSQLVTTGHNWSYKVAAGNSNDDTQFYSPQRIVTAQTWMVGNLTRSITPAGSSNFGSSVDRWAPGTDIWSTWLGGGFNKISGTSMAPPHVAGILAMRGDNSVGITRSTSKGGSQVPNAKL